MGAIVLDASKVNSYVLPSLVKSKNTMQDAYSTSVSLKNSLPSSFRYRSLVNDIVNQIYNVRREISDVNSIIDKKVQKAKTIETKKEGAASKIGTVASNIVMSASTIGGAVVGSATGGITGAVVGGVVGNKVGKTIADTGGKIVSKAVSGVKKLGTSIVNGFKWVGSKIVSAYKSATSWISDRAKKVSDWVSKKFESAKNWTSKALKDTGAFISKTSKSVWAWLKGAASTVWTHIKKIGASIANAVIAFAKGLVKLVEAIGDLVILLGAGIGTIGTSLYDIGKGIITGKWDWSATKGLWKGTKSVVAYDWTSKWIFDPLYNTKFGKWLDDNAYAPFKSDGMGCKILEGVGYVAGVIALTICTFGVGGVATGAATTVSAGVSATTLAATATAAGIGKYTEEEWNKNSISINYGGKDIDIAIDYEKYSEIEKLKRGESTTISQQITLEDGSIGQVEFKITSKGNGKYDIVDSAGNAANLNNLNESNTAKGLLVGTIKGAWEGAQWYVGGKIGAGQFTKITGKIASPIVKKIATSGIRVGLDTATGVVEVPFQSLVTMMSEGKSWDQAWQSQGGWDAVKTQAGIAGLASFLGEIPNLRATTKTSNLDNLSSFKENDSVIYKENADYFGNRASASFTASNVARTRAVEDDVLLALAIHDNTYRNTGDAIKRLDAFINPNSPNYHNYSLLTSQNGARSLLQNYTPEQIDKAIISLKYGKISSLNDSMYTSLFNKSSNFELYDFFENTGKVYGVDQAAIENLCVYKYNGVEYNYRQAKEIINNAKAQGNPIPKFKKEGTWEYLKLKQKLMIQGFSSGDASVILSSINDAGACSYASVCNEIFYKFRNNPDLFRDTFGYSMYKEIDGNVTLNSTELLLDLYLYSNDIKNGGSFIYNKTLNKNFLSDEVDVFNRQILDAENQVYMSGGYGKNVDVIDGFLKSKNSNLQYSSDVFMNNLNKIVYTEELFNNIMKYLESEIDRGKSVSLGIYYNPKNADNNINLLSYDINSYGNMSTATWKEGGGHSVVVTGITSNGLVVSSWGNKYMIPLEDLRNGGKFIITTSNILV